MSLSCEVQNTATRTCMDCTIINTEEYKTRDSKDSFCQLFFPISRVICPFKCLHWVFCYGLKMDWVCHLVEVFHRERRKTQNRLKFTQMSQRMPERHFHHFLLVQCSYNTPSFQHHHCWGCNSELFKSAPKWFKMVPICSSRSAESSCISNYL